MNALITAYEIVCYEVKAVRYLNRSQGTHMVHLKHAPLPHFPCVLSSVALRAGLFFLGEDEKEVPQSFWKDQTDCRNRESARAEMMIPSSGPQRQPSTTKMERGHQKHLQ